MTTYRLLLNVLLSALTLVTGCGTSDENEKPFKEDALTGFENLPAFQGKIEFNSSHFFHRYLGLSDKDWGRIKKDSFGVPQVYRREAKNHVRHPTASLGYLLQRLGIGGSPSEATIKEVREITLNYFNRHIDAVGVIPYEIAYVAGRYQYPFKEGWGSAMAQGYGLSLLAYLIFVDPDFSSEYRRIGNRLINALSVHALEGGLTQYACFNPTACYRYLAEYPTHPPVYTLNGFNFTVAGLYDWVTVTKDAVAERLLREAMATILRILPFFDNEGLSTYDLAHFTWNKPDIINFKPGYHNIHVKQLRKFYAWSSEEAFLCVSDAWKEEFDSRVNVSLSERCALHFPHIGQDQVPYDPRY